MYIGQSHHIAYPPHRNNAAYFPSGFNTIKDRFDGGCFYTASVGGGKAICNMPWNSHSWQTADAGKFYFCGYTTPPPPAPPIEASLGAMNGVAAATYSFKKVDVDPSLGSTFSEIMVKGHAAC